MKLISQPMLAAGLVLLLLVSSVPFVAQEVMAYTGDGRGYVCINFDDGTVGQYDNAYPVLKTSGVVATLYMVTGLIGTAGYLNATQLLALQTDGWEIGSHGVDHVALTNMTIGDATAQMIASKNALTALGLSVSTMAYPYGMTNTALKNAAASYYERQRVTTQDNLYQRPLQASVQTIGEVQPATMVEVRTYVEKAIRTDSPVVFLFHRVQSNGMLDGTDYSISDLVNYLAQQRTDNGLKFVRNTDLSDVGTTYVWDGEGVNNLASNAANWYCDDDGVITDDIAPTAGSALVWNGTSTKACTFDVDAASLMANSWNIGVGYSGTITQAATADIGIGYGGLIQSAGTLTGDVAKKVVLKGDWLRLGGTLTSNKITIQFVDGPITYGSVGVDVFYKWSVETGVYTQNNVYPNKLTVTAVGQLHLGGYASITMGTGGYAYTNNGKIDGTGMLNCILYLNPVVSFGVVDCPVSIYVINGNAGNFVVTLGSSVTFGSTVNVFGDTSYTCTLDMNGYELTANGFTVGVRGIVLGGEGKLRVGGNLDVSAGTFTPETCECVNTGTAKTIKMAVGQTLYRWTVGNGSSVSLLSNVNVTNDFQPWGTVTIGSYTVTYSQLKLMFATSPETNGSVGQLYQYDPNLAFEPFRNGWYYEFNFNTTELSGNRTTGVIVGRPMGLGPIAVAITAHDQYGNTAYQNYTLNVGLPAGVITEQATMDLLMFVVALVITLVIAFVGLYIERPIVTVLAGLFGFVILAAMIANAAYAKYWWFVLVPLIEFLMAGMSMRRGR